MFGLTLLSHMVKEGGGGVMPVNGNAEIGLFFRSEQSKMGLDTRLCEGRWNMIVATMAEAKTNLSRLAAQANETGASIIVFKNKKPWIEIYPLAYPGHSATAVAPRPSDLACEDGPDDYDAIYDDQAERELFVFHA